jgi:Na+-translocating ferredoxin:NAD+ oxidoreductase RNF subunit RnfB
MLADIHVFKDTLPGIDCGSCGSPTCRAFAEDVIKGLTDRDGCPIKALKELKEGKDG